MQWSIPSMMAAISIAAATADTFIITEASDFLITEGSDFLITE